MRIAYVFYWNGARDGVGAKIATQVGLWREHGHDVGAFRLRRGEAGAVVEDETVFPFAGLGARVGATRQLAAAARAFRPDVVYLRYDHFVPPLRSPLGAFPAVVELNEGLGEYRLRGRAVAAYDRLNRAVTLGHADGLVAVTGEIAAEQPGRHDATVIANGIDLRRFEPLPPARAQRARAVFLGSPRMSWHGVDKILELARLLPDVDFDVVGTSAADLPQHPPNVRLHGYLSAVEYQPLLAKADLGIGTLAFHRTGLREGSPLKTREYLAHGLPVVTGYRDTDFLDDDPPWFLCELPNEEGNVHEGAETVAAFVESVRGRRVPHEEVADRIDAAVKERRRLELFARVTGEPGGRRS